MDMNLPNMEELKVNVKNVILSLHFVQQLIVVFTFVLQTKYLNWSFSAGQPWNIPWIMIQNKIDNNNKICPIMLQVQPSIWWSLNSVLRPRLSFR